MESGSNLLAKHFFETCRIDHLENHSPDILRLGGIQDAQHISESDFVQNFRQNKYGVKMSKYAFELLLCFLQDNKFMLLLRITNQYVSIQGEFIAMHSCTFGALPCRMLEYQCRKSILSVTYFCINSCIGQVCP